MGGPAKEDRSAERQIASEQASLGREMLSMSRDEMGHRRELEAPLVDFYKSIIGGDRNKMLQTAAPAVSETTRASAAARENIFDSTSPGAGREYALAMNDSNKNSSISNFINQVWNQAFTGLAGVGRESGQVGLQSAGAGLSGLQGAGQSYGTVMNADANAKASTMGMFGSLAGAAGMAIGRR